MFADRRDAGEKLADELQKYAHQEPVIYAIPRGGVEAAYPVAKRLEAPLRIIVSRKVGAPGNEELAIGAVTPDGTPYWDDNAVKRFGLAERELDAKAHSTVQEIKRRVKAYGGEMEIPSLKNKLAILVDDGLATGLTALAALRCLRKKQPEKLILAVPVAPQDTLKWLQQEADEVICLHAPTFFLAVGQFYKYFPANTDEEIIELLKEAREQRKKDN